MKEDVAEEISCADVENRDLVSGYVANTLSEADAETFERHYLGCSRCADELRLASDIRTTSTSTAPAVAPGRRHYLFVLPFAAAAMLMLSVILWQRGSSEDSTDSLRAGGSDQLQVESAADGSNLRLRWSAAPGAARYRVRLSSADGTPVLQREVAENQLDVPRSQLPAGSSTVVVVIEVFDALGNPLASNAPQTVRLPPN